jgi:hypothetical protein
MNLDHSPGGRLPELNVKIREIRAKLGTIQCHQVIAFVFDLTVITPGKGPGIPNAWTELLPKVNVAESDILGLQVT